MRYPSGGRDAHWLCFQQRHTVPLPQAFSQVSLTLDTLNSESVARFRLATTYHGLGCTYYTMGESDKAVGYHEKSLKLLLAAHGPEHPEVGNAYEGMANIYFSDQKLDLALEYYHKALAVSTKVRCQNTQVV